ncbi:MAG: TonB-dependent receptor plug domain-containing protein [Bacillota bacterium]
MTLRKRTMMNRLILTGVCGLLLAAPLGVWAQEAAEEEEENDVGEIRVTTSTKTEREINDVPVTVEVVTKEELEKKDEPTVQKALRFVTGVDVDFSSGSNGLGTVQINGMEGPHTLVLIDGQRAGVPGGAVLGDISSDMVEQVEVVKGSLSSLYGSDAIGGVVNIITKRWNGQPYNRFSLETGSRDTQIYQGTTSFGKERWGSVVSFSRQESDGVQEGLDDYVKDIFNASLILPLITSLNWR